MTIGMVGVKQSMWAEKGTEGYHPSEAGARRMAMWIRNYFRHGMDRNDPAYPPKKPIEEKPPTSKPEVATASQGERKKSTLKEKVEAIKRARSASSGEETTPHSKKQETVHSFPTWA